MQESINKYFNKLCSEKFFKNDDEEIVGKAKDVIQNLKDQISYAQNLESGLDEIDTDIIIDSANELIEEIDNDYPNKEDVIKIALHPMAGFFVLQDKESLFEELKQYYEEQEEK